MSRFVRSSKYRHVFGKEARRDDCYDQIKVTRSAWDTNKVSASTEFFGVVWEAGGGGAFVVVPHDQTGKRTPNPPLIAGHKAAVLDIQFNPFNPYLVGSTSEDCMVKLWSIPEGGLTDTVTEEAQLLKGHKRKVGLLEWHPVANNVLATSGTDYLVKIWDAETGKAQLDIKGHSNIIQSNEWNKDGSMMATASKDKKLRLFDLRSSEEIQEWAGHAGIKGQKMIWLGSTGFLCSVGFSRSADRQYYVWDPKKLDKPLAKTNIDTSSGMLMPFYDDDTSLLFLAGKGDGNIRYYEVTGEDKISYYLSEYKSSDPQKGLAVCPKRMLDILSCEVLRFLKITPKNQVIPVSMKVPRKSDLFQDDIFPDTYAGIAGLTSEQYFSGDNADPPLVNLEPEEGALKKSTAPPPETSFKKVEEAKELTPLEMKEEIAKLSKRVAYLEAELVKKDAKIKSLEG